MQIKVREGYVFPLNRPQQVWWGDSPEVSNRPAMSSTQPRKAKTSSALKFK